MTTTPWDVWQAIGTVQLARVELEAMRMAVFGQDARDQLGNVIRVLDHVLSVVWPDMLDKGKASEIPPMAARIAGVVNEVLGYQAINTAPGAVVELAKGAVVEINTIVKGSASFVDKMAKPITYAVGAYFTWRIVDALRGKDR